MFTKLNLNIQDGIARIRMDDGKVNAMSHDMLNEISRALDAADEKDTIVILSGREGQFSAGFDLKTFQRGPEESRKMVMAGAELILKFLEFPSPIFAVCTGHAYPMGAFLLLASDVRYGVAGPFRIGLNEPAIGITVPRFAIELARHRLNPNGFARISAAMMFNPEDAARVGYLDHVYSAEEIQLAVEDEALRLRALDRGSFRATKQRINSRATEAISSAIAEEFTLSGA